jgi:tRNA dimethylallyltransferase
MILIAGATGVGKSVVAHRVAAALGGEIINADSMQVYRDLEVLTSRPSADLTSSIAHHLYGFVDGSESYGLGRWLPAAVDVASRIAQRGRVPIFVGGTGLYLTSLERGYVPRERTVIRQADTDGLTPGWIKRGAYIRDKPSTQSGVKYIDPDGSLAFVLERPRAELYSRIEKNFSDMVSAGALREVQRLLERRLDPNLPIMKALGVRELSRHIVGDLPLDEAIALGQASSRKFARRQMTWFRNQMKQWSFIPVNGAVEEIVDLAASVGAN